MTNAGKHVLTALAATALLATAFGTGTERSLAHEENGEARALPVDEIRRIVRDYLLEEPEILIEAQNVLRERHAQAMAERDRNAIRNNFAALFADAEAPVAGNPDGPVAVVEFFDYRCGHCRRVTPVLQTLLAENDDVRLIYKELPILGPESVNAAVAALAAREQGRYTNFHHALMTASGELDPQRVQEIAASVGLDVARLADDMKDPAIMALLQRNRDLANALGIDGTPAFVMGERVLRGAQTPRQFQAIVADMRAALAASDK